MHWQLPLQDAINLPSFGSLNGPTFLEAGRFGRGVIDTLNSRGHKVQEYELPSGLHALERTKVGILGAADPRREGVVLGD
jgi:gamma-glutamyltranspeptidase/glutathione hydrolase